MKIYIGFSKPTTRFPIFGWIIQWVLRRPYDHVYIRFQEPMDNTFMIFQASKMMTNMYSIDNFLKENLPIKEYELECTNEVYKELWRFAMVKLGVRYSVLQTFGILLTKIFKNLKQPFHTEDEFCSKLVAQACVLLGITIPENADDVDPSDMDQLLNDNLVRCQLNPAIK